MDYASFMLIIFSGAHLAAASLFGNFHNEDERFKTFSLPENTELKRALGYSETSISNFSVIAEKHGYSTETHEVTTEDGYILTMFRIPRGKQCRGKIKSPPILMMHGLLESSDSFLVAGPKVGLGYILPDRCYDVWFGNTRGNTYSRKHILLNPNKDGPFWDFTFDDFGKYDQPALIDYILKQTGAKKINYVGHSQGNLVFFVMASTRVEYNDKIQVAICLAPIAWMHHMFNPLFQFISKATPEIKKAAGLVGLKEVFGNKQASGNVAQFICQYFSFSLCNPLMFLITGNNPKYLKSETLRALIGRSPAGTSVNNLEHYGQALLVDGFRRYDMGRKKNLQVYGTPQPPSYDVTKISAPVAIFWGKNDWMAHVKDVANLKEKLPNLVEFVTMEPNDWSHVDFTWGERIPKYLVTSLIDCLNKYS